MDPNTDIRKRRISRQYFQRRPSRLDTPSEEGAAGQDHPPSTPGPDAHTCAVRPKAAVSSSIATSGQEIHQGIIQIGGYSEQPAKSVQCDSSR